MKHHYFDSWRTLGFLLVLTVIGIQGASPTDDPVINAIATKNGRADNIKFVNGLPVEAETWSRQESPYIYHNLNVDMEYAVDQLPDEASMKLKPWSGSYWPTHLDSINYRWAGNDTLSPAEKYEKAFNVTGLAKDISRSLGVYAHFLGKNLTKCTTKSDCQKGEECATRPGRPERNIEPDSICIPVWYGICHAWAAAAVAEPEPMSAVEVNGVTFDLNDIKALVSLMYDMSFDKMVESRFIGSRCDKPLSELPMDQFQRVLDPKCRGLNAGSFHLAITNLLGRNGVSFFFNRKLGNEVWNQPLISYRVVSKREMSRNAAIQSIPGASESSNPFSPETSRFMFYRTNITYAKESDPKAIKGRTNYHKVITLDYLLEIDSSGNIVGGEWLGPSRLNHPAFLTVITKRYEDSTMFQGRMKWKIVRKLLQVSVRQKDGKLSSL